MPALAVVTGAFAAVERAPVEAVALPSLTLVFVVLPLASSLAVRSTDDTQLAPERVLNDGVKRRIINRVC